MKIINRLADGVTNHRGMAFIMAVFDEFIEHAQLHFAMEETPDGASLIKRSEFNAGKFAPNVGDDVTLDIAIEAIKAD